jgi:hypothetical protein
MQNPERKTRRQRKAEQQAQERADGGVGVARGALGAGMVALNERSRTERYLRAPSLTQEDIEKMWDPKTYQQSWQNPSDNKSIGSSQQEISIHAFTYGGYETYALGQRRFALHHPKDCTLYAVYINSEPPQRPEFGSGERPVLYRVVSASFKKVESGKEVEFAYVSTTDIARETKELVGPWLSPLSEGIVLMDIGYQFDPTPGHPSQGVTIRVTPVFATAAVRKTYNKQL